jgi:hypothetical protein
VTHTCLQLGCSGLATGGDPTHHVVAPQVRTTSQETTKMEKFIVHFLEDDDKILMAIQINTYIIHLSQQNNWGGSVSGRMVLDCGWLEGDFQLFNDYFSENPTYPEFLSRQRFCMRIGSFRRIVQIFKITMNTFFENVMPLEN